MIEDTINRYYPIAESLIALFEARFDPSLSDVLRDKQMKGVKEQIEKALEGVQSLDQDRILRRYLNLILATLRTNAYQVNTKGVRKPYVSFKFDCAAIEDLPSPRPKFEIFVYSPRVEAVHLRGGKVARGGIRWSDRREDFRTEILGLLKAQMIKNAVIVPVGSKGGFVVKNLPEDRAQQKEEVIACYRMMISGMLDLTDNIINGQTKTPEGVVRYDDLDPYLVVAADKGTASFSDIANALSQEYGFWLDDAFASGGSSGYDHKKMGITARGAWESTRRHFRELGMRPDRDSFSVVGIGDMSGDIFGNGMLLSKKIRLVAAFNHQHIFLDPTPDEALSYKERERMFKLNSSTWMDYNTALISAGGGIFSRDEKAILITPEVRHLLDIPESIERLPPHELIHYILKARVDLLWFGGIGTFVKAFSETHVDVGDRSNDALRVDGRDLRCRVVVEGANLGMTQQGRIECALQGIKVNTDALDNSGGVDCSDHEVNIKVLLGGVVKAGGMSLEERNTLLEKMTERVAALVLRDNYLQNQILSLKEYPASQHIELHALFIKRLEEEGILQRQEVGLPTESILAERITQQRGLTRPELAVMLAHGKIWVYDHIHLAISLIEDPYLQQDLIRYFPEDLQERYAHEITEHPLKREITATCLANEVVNRFSASFIFRLETITGQPIAVIVKALRIIMAVFDALTLWSALEALDDVLAWELQLELYLHINKALEKAILWILQQGVIDQDIATIVLRYAPGIKKLLKALPQNLNAEEKESYVQQTQELVTQGVTASLAATLTALKYLGDTSLDIVHTSLQTKHTIEDTSHAYSFVGHRLGFNWARKVLDGLILKDAWQKMSRALLFTDLIDHQSALTKNILMYISQNQGARLDAWEKKYKEEIRRIELLLKEMQGTHDLGLAGLDILSRHLGSLARHSSP